MVNFNYNTSCHNQFKNINSKTYFDDTRVRYFKQSVGDTCTYYGSLSHLDINNPISNIDTNIYNVNNGVYNISYNSKVIESYGYSVQIDLSDLSIYPGEEFLVVNKIYLHNGDSKTISFKLQATDNFGYIKGDLKQALYVFNPTSSPQADCVIKSYDKPSDCLSEYENVSMTVYERSSLPSIPEKINYVVARFDTNVNYEIYTKTGQLFQSDDLKSNCIITLSRVEAERFYFSPSKNCNKVTANVYFFIEKPNF